MLMAAKNQLKVSLLSIKYGIMREMVNKVSFIMNIIMMVLNNASFIILWVVFYSIKDSIGGSSFKDVLLLWALASGTYGFSHTLFINSFNLSKQIYNGKLDAYLVQPKNVLLQTISGVSASALGDILYGYIILIILGCNIWQYILFTLFCFTGGCIMAAISVIYGSLSFWFNNTESIVNTANSMLGQFATYPEGIFNKTIKVILYTVVPVGIANYLPASIIANFNIYTFLIVLFVTAIIVALAFIVFYLGLRKYSSSNLMIARI